MLTGSSFIICPHGGRLGHLSKAAPGGSIMLDGQFVFFYDDAYYLTGCRIGCDRVEWLNYYPDLLFHKRYFLTNQSYAKCLHPLKGFTGFALILFFQIRVDIDEFIRLYVKSN